jgi:copper(I)-binding protein
MTRLVPIMIIPLFLFGCGQPAAAPHATVTDAVVTLPALPGRPGAGYFSIAADRPARLTGIASPAAGRVELHESMNHGGMTGMAPLAAPAVGPDAPLVFAAGGKHAMLFDIAPTVQVGGRMQLTFTFDTLPPVTVEAEVRAPGDAGHGGH